MQFNRKKYIEKLIRKQKNGMIKIITGLRRSGKSYLLFNLFYDYLLNNGYDKDHIVKINFDDKEHLDYRKSDKAYSLIKSQIIDDHNYVVMLDEIQNVEDFVPILNSILHMKNVDCYVTGSNSKFLSKDVITEFRGRGDEIHLYPLSYQELIEKFENKQKCFEDYITFGGLPYIYTDLTLEERTEYLKKIFNETYIIDIIERYNIKKNKEFDDLMNILASDIGSLVSIPKIIKTFKSIYKIDMTIPTIYNYIEMLKDTFLISEVERYDIKGRKHIGALKKYYYEDIGLRNARIGFRQNEKSHLMENIIYNELKRRGYEVDIGIVNKKITQKNLRVNKQYEVDFIAQRGYQKYYIQSAYEMDTDKKREQEYKSLNLIEDGFKRFVIRYDNNQTYINDYGIINVGLYDFLLNDNCFDFN